MVIFGRPPSINLRSKSQVHSSLLVGHQFEQFRSWRILIPPPTKGGKGKGKKDEKGDKGKGKGKNRSIAVPQALRGLTVKAADGRSNAWILRSPENRSCKMLEWQWQAWTRNTWKGQEGEYAETFRALLEQGV